MISPRSVHFASAAYLRVPLRKELLCGGVAPTVDPVFIGRVFDLAQVAAYINHWKWCIGFLILVPCVKRLRLLYTVDNSRWMRLKPCSVYCWRETLLATSAGPELASKSHGCRRSSAPLARLLASTSSSRCCGRTPPASLLGEMLSSPHGQVFCFGSSDAIC